MERLITGYDVIVDGTDTFETRYTLNDAAVWSDNEPIKYEDYLLEWAARSIADGVDEDGDPKPLFNHVSGLDMADLVPARDEQRYSVKPGQGPGAVRVVAKRDLGLAAIPAQGNAGDDAVFDELDRRLETEYLLIPRATASDVTDRDLDVVDSGDHLVLRSCS